jgi:hypothetical protein
MALSRKAGSIRLSRTAVWEAVGDFQPPEHWDYSALVGNAVEQRVGRSVYARPRSTSSTQAKHRERGSPPALFDEILAAQPTKRDASAHVADTLRGLARLPKPAAAGFGRNEAGNHLPVPSNTGFQ